MQSKERNSDQYNISEEFKDIPEIKKLSKKQEGDAKKRSLFANCVFLLNRETPIYALQYLVLSFGGTFLTQDEEAKTLSKVTHHVMDRPLTGKL